MTISHACVYTCKLPSFCVIICLPIIIAPPTHTPTHHTHTHPHTHTHTVSLRTIVIPNGRYPNGFTGFLIQARESTDTFVPESSIYGTWEDDRPLYKLLNCGKSMDDTSVLYPVSLQDFYIAFYDVYAPKSWH